MFSLDSRPLSWRRLWMFFRTFTLSLKKTTRFFSDLYCGCLEKKAHKSMHPSQPLIVDHTQRSSHSASRNLLVLTFKCSHQVLAPVGSPGNHRLALILCVCSPDFKVAVCLPTSVLCQVQETPLVLLLLILKRIH